MDNPAARWRKRATILAEFTSRLSRESSGEDLTIEWSSSDEEVIQPIYTPVTASETKAHAPIKKDKHSEAYELLLPSVPDQNSSSENEKELISPHKPDGEKALLSTRCDQEKKPNAPSMQCSQPLFKHHDIDRKENEVETKDTELLLPMSESCLDEALSLTSGSGINAPEPQSPILGSRRIVAGSCSPVVRARRVRIKASSPVFGSCKRPKRKLILSDTVSVKRQINNDNISNNWRLRRNDKRNVISVDGHLVSTDFLNSNIKTGNWNDVHKAEVYEYSSEIRVSQDEAVQNSEKNNYLHIPLRECEGEQTPSDLVYHPCEKKIQFGSHGSQNNSETLDVDLKQSVWHHVSLPQGYSGFSVDDCASQYIAVPSEGTDSQLDCNIDSSLTPCKNSLNGMDISEDTASSALHVGSTTGQLGLDDNTRSGFDWVKHLQTPQKLLSSENKVDGMESAKKKLIKDGQAQHLKRVLMSWRSCITVWSHELSLTILFGTSPRQSPSLPCKVQHHAISPSGVLKLDPKSKINEVKPMCSPSVKKLHDLFIENPGSSPETTLWSCSRKVSQKYLDLRLIDVGGQLPNNAALCEAMGSNVEEFQTSVGIKKENAEAALTGQFKKFLVFFALDEHNITSLHRFHTVRVYATWQNLSISFHDVPALFTSYFKFYPREEEPTSFPMDCRRSVIHTWTCSCSDKLTAVSPCGGKPCTFPWVSNVQVCHILLPSGQSEFSTIKDTPDTPPQNCKLRAGTILEALERCGGVSAVPVTITVRIHRTITRREPASSVEYWELVGQDAEGKFCIVKIPNWPLAQQLMEMLSGSDGSHSTYTLTHLMITQRLTNTQNPGVFSLISSLHNAYQKSVLQDPLLQPILQDLASCPLQTHCYLLTASLGVTRILNSEEQITFPIKLPCWSLREALTVSRDGQRGSVTAYVLYKTSSSLHIVSPISHQKGGLSMFSIGKKTEEIQETVLISRVLLIGAALAPEWPESGPVMQSVILKDVAVWHGNLVLDEYSFIEVQEQGGTKIDLATLNQALTPLSHHTQQDSLTLVSGTIIKVEEDSAFVYFICGNCKSDKVQEAGEGHVDCVLCGQKSIFPSKDYFLEVWLDCGSDFQQAFVKVKLYQKTIQRLLLSHCDPQEEKCSAASLLGHQIGPMACVLLQLQRPRNCSTSTYNLTELPY